MLSTGMRGPDGEGVSMASLSEKESLVWSREPAMESPSVVVVAMAKVCGN